MGGALVRVVTDGLRRGQSEKSSRVKDPLNLIYVCDGITRIIMIIHKEES